MEHILHKPKKLLKYYNNGYFKELIKNYGDIIQTNNWCGSGAQICSFQHDKYPNQIIKICPKTVSFFSLKMGNSSDFKKYINSHYPVLIKVNKILYENDKLFVFTQRKCVVMTSELLSKIRIFYAISMLYNVLYMFKSGNIITDICLYNTGIIDDFIIIFDDHDLRPIQQKKKWGKSRLFKHVLHYMTVLNATEYQFNLTHNLFVNNSHNIKFDFPKIINELYECNKVHLTEKQRKILLNHTFNGI